jgi:hypothetical protein
MYVLPPSSPWWWRQHFPLKRRSTINLHGSTSKKTNLNFILAAVRTWYLTYLIHVWYFDIYFRPISMFKILGVAMKQSPSCETPGLPIGRPDMRVKHWFCGHSVPTLLNARGVATVSHKYSLTVARHVVVAVPSTVHYPANYKIKNIIYAGI